VAGIPHSTAVYLVSVKSSSKEQEKNEICWPTARFINSEVTEKMIYECVFYCYCVVIV
jgi:hypothetical protein